MIGSQGIVIKASELVRRMNDLYNRRLALEGRALGSFNPEYLFLDGAPKPLYGLEYIQEQSRVFITEGLFDWLALIQ